MDLKAFISFICVEITLLAQNKYHIFQILCFNDSFDIMWPCFDIYRAVRDV